MNNENMPTVNDEDVNAMHMQAQLTITAKVQQEQAIKDYFRLKELKLVIDTVKSISELDDVDNTPFELELIKQAEIVINRIVDRGR
jgi:hypothetical protein